MVGSAKSSSGHRKKRQRPPSEAPHSPGSVSPSPKRQRTASEQDEYVSIPTVEVDEDEDAQTPIVPDEDEGDNKENTVEVRNRHEPATPLRFEEPCRFV